MKKIINSPEAVVSDMLAGIAMAHPALCYDPEGEVIHRREKGDKMGIVSGGGSGHEPAHAGYVGKGMLDAAVAGNVFASPSPNRILNGIEKADMKSAAEIAAVMVDKITGDLDYSGSEVAVMVNGLGGTPLMELYILAKEADRLLREKGAQPVKYFVGNYMTSLEMAGASLSVLKLDEELKELLARPCDTPALKENG